MTGRKVTIYRQVCGGDFVVINAIEAAADLVGDCEGLFSILCSPIAIVVSIELSAVSV